MRLLIFLFLLSIVSCSICDSKSNFKNLKISSVEKENRELVNIDILDKCVINKFWQFKNKSNSHNNRIFIDSDLKRVLLRFEYYQEQLEHNEKLSITINSTIIQGIGITFMSQSQFDISVNEIVDTFINFKCLNNSNNYFTIKIQIKVINEVLKKELNFDLWLTKLCDCAVKDGLDIAHIILLIIISGIIYASVLKHFSSKFEETILGKYPEIRNPENLSIISIIIAIVLWFFYVIDTLHFWIYFTIFFVITISVGMIFEGLLKGFPIKNQLSNRTLEIDFLGSITMFFLLCLFIGVVTLILWLVSFNWLIGDFIAIAISIETIRIFKFTSFKFMLTLSSVIWIYDLYCLIYKDNFYTIHSRLTDQFDNSFPTLISFPQISYTFFREIIRIPISDVIIPGMLINYFFRFDQVSNTKYLYFYSSFGILIGCIFCKFVIFSHLHLFIPSFFIIFPIMIIGIFILSYSRGEFTQIIDGFKSNVFAEKEIEKKQLEKIAHVIITNNPLEMNFINQETNHI